MRTGIEIRSLTGLRGIAAFYVVFFHFLRCIPTNPITVFSDHGYIAVDLFFVLSGFVMALNYGHMFDGGFAMGKYLTFLGRRIARIYPLYIVGMLIGFVYVRNDLFQTHWGASLGLLALNVTMMQNWLNGVREWSLDPPAWSISVEWAAYLAFPILAGLTLFRGPWRAASVGILLAVLLFATGTAYAPPIIVCLVEFCFGLLAFRWHDTPLGSALGQRLPSLLIGIVTVAALFIYRADPVIVLLFPLLLVSLVADIGPVAVLLNTRFCQWAGDISYSLYLLHYFFLPFSLWLTRMITAHGYAHGRVYAGLLSIFLAVIAAMLAYHLVEKPGRRSLRHLFEGRRKSFPTQAAIEPAEQLRRQDTAAT